MITAQSLDAITDDMVARYAAHVLRQHNDGTWHRPTLTASCSCGWESAVVSKDLRPQWEAIDGHLVDALPDWPRDTCWCGRVVLLSPLGAWFHADPAFHGHDAAVRP